MKEKIIIFVVGLLLGAIISTGSIYIYTITNNTGDNIVQKPNTNNPMGENTGTPPEIPNNSQNNIES